MREVYDFLKKCGTYYLATVDGGRPRVRPFGTAAVFEDKLYIQTGKVKDVAKQLQSNPRVEICACDGGTWLRIQAEAVEDDRREAKRHMLEEYPMLRGRYSEDDGNTLVLYLKNAEASFESFEGPKKTVAF